MTFFSLLAERCVSDGDETSCAGASGRCRGCPPTTQTDFPADVSARTARRVRRIPTARAAHIHGFPVDLPHHGPSPTIARTSVAAANRRPRAALASSTDPPGPSGCSLPDSTAAANRQHLGLFDFRRQSGTTLRDARACPSVSVARLNRLPPCRSNSLPALFADRVFDDDPAPAPPIAVPTITAVGVAKPHGNTGRPRSTRQTHCVDCPIPVMPDHAPAGQCKHGDHQHRRATNTPPRYAVKPAL